MRKWDGGMKGKAREERVQRKERETRQKGKSG